MSNKKIRLHYYFRQKLKHSKNIDQTLEELTSKFQKYYDEIVDMYIIIKENKNNTHKKQLKKYKYTSYIYNNRKKSQQEIIDKIKNNII